MVPDIHRPSSEHTTRTICRIDKLMSLQDKTIYEIDNQIFARWTHVRNALLAYMNKNGTPYLIEEERLVKEEPFDLLYLEDAVLHMENIKRIFDVRMRTEWKCVKESIDEWKKYYKIFVSKV